MKNQPISPKLGILLVGHGTKDTHGQQAFHKLTQLVTDKLPQLSVESCFLELAEPNIASAIEQLAKSEVESFIVVPMLLFEAGHAKLDIPRKVRKYAELSKLKILGQTAAFQLHEKMVEISFNRLSTVLDLLSQADRSEGLHLLYIGRGSKDDTATIKMLEFVERCKLKSNIGDNSSSVCFFAMASPDIDSAIHSLLQNSPKIVVIQPHFLFPGVLPKQIMEKVDDLRQKYPQIQWELTEILGADPLLAELVEDLVLAKMNEISLE